MSSSYWKNKVVYKTIMCMVWDSSYYCTSTETCYLYFPSIWRCIIWASPIGDLTGNRTDFAFAGKEDFTVSCGCSGIPRTSFDRKLAAKYSPRYPPRVIFIDSYDRSTSSRFGDRRMMIAYIFWTIAIIGRLYICLFTNADHPAIDRRGSVPMAEATPAIELADRRV